MFAGFARHRIHCAGAEINVVSAGSGPPLLLLHGFPQNLALWHEVAPTLAQDYTVVAADLRGYGDSAKPESGDDHAGYSFRAMAGDQVEVMRQLGHDAFSVIGHDRGARVGHRMALDHPDAVERLAVLDIAPTRHVYGTIDQRMATAYYHWFFLIQPNGVPEHLVGLDPMFYLHTSLGSLGGQLDVYSPEALASYERCFADPHTRHAMFEDYRAGASIDLVHDEADRDRKLAMPLLVLWGTQGVVHQWENPLDIWRGYAHDVRGRSIESGHFLVETRPDEIVTEIRAFVPR
jgi:haloacetate dehalogenase